MAIQLNHTIVPAYDKTAAAQFFAAVFGLPVGGEAGPFMPVRVNDELTLDFDTTDQFEPHHYVLEPRQQRHEVPGAARS